MHSYIRKSDFPSAVPSENTEASSNSLTKFRLVVRSGANAHQITRLFSYLAVVYGQYKIHNDRECLVCGIFSNILQQQQRHVCYKIHEQVRICLFFFIKFKRHVSSGVPHYHTDKLHILLAAPPLAPWNRRADVGPPNPVSPKQRFTKRKLNTENMSLGETIRRKMPVFFQFRKLHPRVQNPKKFHTETGIEIHLLFESADLSHFETQCTEFNKKC